MAGELPQRVPLNAPGDFYVERGLCTRCCLVHGEAPSLLNDPNAEFDECYFVRQPSTAEEVKQAIDAMCVSEMCALRYAGSDPKVIAALRARKQGYLCDNTPEGQPSLARISAAVQKHERQLVGERQISWKLRLVGIGIGAVGILLGLLIAASRRR